MKIKLNPDPEIVNTIREGLKRTGGYCPCRREHTEATKCMCQEFKNQIADPGFEGFCHCMLYYKSLKNKGRNAMLLGLIVMVLYKPRTWCAFCPMGTMTQGICKLKNKE